MNFGVTKKIILFSLFVGVSVYAAPNFALAQSTVQVFFVDPQFDSLSREQVTSTLRNTSRNSYIYVEDDFYNSLDGSQKSQLNSQLVSLGNEFDNTIYPNLRGLYGSEWIPGIDNDARITILFTPLSSGARGYVNTVDELSKSESANSNEREMMYIDTTDISLDITRSYIAHEFTHLITYNQKDRLKNISEEEWLFEAIAEYAPTALGYNNVYENSYLAQRVDNFLNLPSDSLTEWQGTAFDAAAVNLFVHYLVDSYGDGILRNILATSSTGTSAVDNALTQSGYAASFSDVFRNWTVANYINNTTSNNSSQYKYNNSNLQFSNFHITPLITSTVFAGDENSLTISVKAWEGRWYRFLPGELGAVDNNILKIEFTSSRDRDFSKFTVPYILTDFSGRKSVQFMSVVNGSAIAYIPEFGRQTLSVVVAPANHLTDLDDFYPFVPFTLKSSLVNEIPPTPQLYAEGSLLRAIGDEKVYVITNGTKRWIQSPEIFNGYGHLRWSDIINVTPSVLATYTESSLIQLAGDPKVYEVTPTGLKRWLNVTPAQFNVSGRKWNAIYTVNENEFRWFRLGSNITS